MLSDFLGERIYAITEAKTIASDYDVIFCATSFVGIFKNAAACDTTVISMRNILSLEEIRPRLQNIGSCAARRPYTGTPRIPPY